MSLLNHASPTEQAQNDQRRRRRHLLYDQCPAPPSAKWRSCRIHIIVLTLAGKPVFSMYSGGSDHINRNIDSKQNHSTSLCSNAENGHRFGLHALASSAALIVTFINGLIDIGCGELRLVDIEPKRRMAIKRFGPLYCIAICRDQREPNATLDILLDRMYALIVSVTTVAALEHLERTPSMDLAQLLAGCEPHMRDFMNNCQNHYGLLTESIVPLPLPATLRNQLGEGLRRGLAGKHLLYGILSNNYRVIHVVRSRDVLLHPLDVSILLNFCMNNQSLCGSETWAPICLPKHDPRGLCYAYNCHLCENICLTLVSNSSTLFPAMQDAKQKIMDLFIREHMLDHVDTIKLACRYSVSDTVDANSTSFMKPCKHPKIIPKKLPMHFLFRSEQHKQVTFCKHEFSVTIDRHIMIGYKTLLSNTRFCIHTDRDYTGSHSLLWIVQAQLHLLSLVREDEYQLLVVFDVNVSQEEAVTAGLAIIDWVKTNSSSLFL